MLNFTRQCVKLCFVTPLIHWEYTRCVQGDEPIVEPVVEESGGPMVEKSAEPVVGELSMSLAEDAKAQYMWKALPTWVKCDLDGIPILPLEVNGLAERCSAFPKWSKPETGQTTLTKWSKHGLDSHHSNPAEPANPMNMMAQVQSLLASSQQDKEKR